MAALLFPHQLGTQACSDQTSCCCRASVFVVCQAGTYNVQSGMGPITRDPNCNGTHCELFTQPIVATLQVAVWALSLPTAAQVAKHAFKCTACLLPTPLQP